MGKAERALLVKLTSSQTRHAHGTVLASTVRYGCKSSGSPRVGGNRNPNTRMLVQSKMGNTLGKAAFVDFAVQWSMGTLAILLGTEKFFDLVGTLTFPLLALLSLKRNGLLPSTRQKTQTALVCAWAVRLGLFLFRRVMKSGGDSRFSKVRDNPRVFIMYWTVQGMLTQFDNGR